MTKLTLWQPVIIEAESNFDDWVTIRTFQPEISSLRDHLVQVASDRADAAVNHLRTAIINAQETASVATGWAGSLRLALKSDMLAKPKRALGIAATFGFVIGLMKGR